jgi:hypothetical protein
MHVGGNGFVRRKALWTLAMVGAVVLLAASSAGAPTALGLGGSSIGRVPIPIGQIGPAATPFDHGSALTPTSGRLLAFAPHV